MSGEAEILRSFLVKLGFQVDKASAKLFDAKVGAATKGVLALGTAAAGVAAAVSYAVKNIGEKLDELYWTSQRTGASAANIKAYGFAISQLGGTSEGAIGSLENLARFMRNSPGAEGLLKNLGVQTRDGNGQLRDTVDLVGELGTALRAMPYYKANAFANVLGMDERTLMAMRNGTGEFAKEYHDLLARAGLDMQTASRDGMLLTREFRSMSAAVGVLMTKFASLLSARFALNMRRMREQLVANFDRITQVMETVIRAVGLVVDGVVKLFYRGAQVIGEFLDWLGKLNPLFLDVAKAVAVVAAGWRVLSAVISLSPLGRVLALGAALLALYDDYVTWKEGGKSLIDWGKWESEVDIAVGLFNMLRDAIKSAFEWLNKFGRYVADSRFGESVGALAAHVLAAMGNKEAQEAVAATARAARMSGPATPGDAPAAPAKPRQAPHVAGASPADNAATPERTDRAMQFFMSSGWTKEQAAGIVANLSRESGLNPQAKGDGGQALGIAQWHPDRQANFAKFTGHDLNTSTLDEQLRFVQHELTQGAERLAGDALRATQSADLAAEVVSTRYERPADAEGEAARRGDMAVKIAQTTNITVQGTGDPKGTAQAVAAAQNDVNNQLTRNTRGAVR